MKIRSGILRAVAIIATLGLTTSAWADCNLNKAQTGASNTFELSGQGNFTCAALNMNEVTSGSIFTPNGDSVNWAYSIVPGPPVVRVSAVVVTPSRGARCVYLYPNQAESGIMLTPGGNKPVSEAVACNDESDGIAEAFATVSADTGNVTESAALAATLETMGSVTITDPDPADAIALVETFDSVKFLDPLTGAPISTFSVESDGVWTYLANNDYFMELVGFDDGDIEEETFTITSKNGATNIVTVYINGINDPVAEVGPKLPITTTADSCVATLTVAGVTDPIVFEGGVVLAESIDGQVKAVCNAEAGDTQAYCEDSCVTFMDQGESTACLLSAKTLGTGEYGLADCKPCKTALDVMAEGGNPPLHPFDGSQNEGLPMEFCWEKTGSVYEGPGDLSDPDDPPQFKDGATGNLVPRTAGTMLKHTAIRQSDYSITWYNKCRKTSIELNGRTYYTTTCR